MPGGAQHRLDREIRPKRTGVLSQYQNGSLIVGFPCYDCCLNLRGIRFFKAFLLFFTPFGVFRARHEFAPSMPIEQTVDRALCHLVTNLCAHSPT
jgi:hypothetical protein